MDFFERTGPMAIGSRLRGLAERVTRDASAIYRLYGIELKPKWFPVFFSLTDEGPKTVTSIAKEIGQTHASVSTIVKEMLAAQIVCEVGGEPDRRRTVVTLTEKGRRLALQVIVQCRDVGRAVDQILAETENNLWKAIAEWECLLSAKSIFDRVAEIKAERERPQVEIVEYEDTHREAFARFNKEWIERYWELEPHDIEVLSDPRRHILDPGGRIFVALSGGEPVGVCALCKLDRSPYDYELAKLAVSTSALRQGIGMRLCRHAIERAKAEGAKTVFLESNTRLKPAIALYRRLGFVELPDFHPAYSRGDIQMVLNLNNGIL